jgi:hypothetical protein
MKCNRFDYTKYDETSANLQQVFKSYFQDIETLAESELLDGRWKSLFFTKLEEAYMCVGKAIRDMQVERTNKIDLEEARGVE